MKLINMLIVAVFFMFIAGCSSDEAPKTETKATIESSSSMTTNETMDKAKEAAAAMKKTAHETVEAVKKASEDAYEAAKQLTEAATDSVEETTDKAMTDGTNALDAMKSDFTKKE